MFVLFKVFKYTDKMRRAERKKHTHTHDLETEFPSQSSHLTSHSAGKSISSSSARVCAIRIKRMTACDLSRSCDPLPRIRQSNKSISVLWTYGKSQNRAQRTPKQEMTTTATAVAVCWTPLFVFSSDNLPSSALYLASGLASIGDTRVYNDCITL